MRSSDADTIASGVSSRILMCRAGEGIFGAHSWKGPVAIVCGSGNNAGDGYVLALYLQHSQIPCHLFLAENKFSEDGRYYFELCQKQAIPYEICDENTNFIGYYEIVDCLFGTGFRKKPSDLYTNLIQKINATPAYVVSADINSGLSGDSGLGDPHVYSDLTVSIGFFKPGHFLGYAKDSMAKLINLDIGIRISGTPFYLTEKEDFKSVLVDRKNFCNKGDFGYITLLGGCADYLGAMKLANLSASALRAGCGVAKLAVPASCISSVSPYLLESTLCPISDQNGNMIFQPKEIEKAFYRVRAAAIGMGWGQGKENQNILTYILENFSIPLVIDADGINTVAAIGTDILKKTKCQVILTPHLKEFERISGIPIDQTLENPIAHASRFAKEFQVTLLLKGTTTIVTNGDIVYLVDRGCPGMATAGSGDVLSGIIAGLLGYSNQSIPLTVACGAWIAGRAGELAQSKLNAISMLSGDTVRAIPDAISEIISTPSKENSKF
jgi:NAD(P)H-hydrate epimerase